MARGERAPPAGSARPVRPLHGQSPRQRALPLRLLLGAGAAAFSLPLCPAPASAATIHPWCAISRGAGVSYRNCSFATFEACRAEILGLGGSCQPNPYYEGPPAPVERSRAHRSRAYERSRL